MVAASDAVVRFFCDPSAPAELCGPEYLDALREARLETMAISMVLGHMVTNDDGQGHAHPAWSRHADLFYPRKIAKRYVNVVCAMLESKTHVAGGAFAGLATANVPNIAITCRASKKPPAQALAGLSFYDWIVVPTAEDFEWFVGLGVNVDRLTPQSDGLPVILGNALAPGFAPVYRSSVH